MCLEFRTHSIFEFQDGYSNYSTILTTEYKFAITFPAPFTKDITKFQKHHYQSFVTDLVLYQIFFFRKFKQGYKALVYEQKLLYETYF